MMQIYLKPSCRKMIMRAARPTENTVNEVIVSAGVPWDLRSNTPEFINAQRYKIKDYSLKNIEMGGTKRWEHS